MHFRIKTLVDITETNIRRQHNKKSYQQDNFDTVIQTIGLRVNIDNIKVYTVDEPCDNQFGSDYAEIQKVWIFDFEPSAIDSTSVGAMQEDFNQIPFIDQLDETVEFETPCFLTTDARKQNIIFLLVE